MSIDELIDLAAFLDTTDRPDLQAIVIRELTLRRAMRDAVLDLVEQG